jgi:4-amino-4-deoxy-L-arabinose transferase-like glycosyltransferase
VPTSAKIARVNGVSFIRDLLVSAGVTLATALLLVATSPSLPIVWDEGDTIGRAEAIADSNAPWPYTTVREGHPPLSGLLVAVGYAVAPPGLDPLTRYRFGSMLLFSLASGVMFYRLRRDYRLWIVPVVAVTVLLAMPRMFAEAHFATLDGPVTACWVLTWAAFGSARASHWWTPLLSLALGLTLAAKFTGWLAIVPLVAWTLLYRDRRGAVALAVAVPLAVGVFVALNPLLWSDPVGGLRTFFALNLNRADNPGLNITTQFFGRLYNLDHPLPWYNTLVWTFITVSPMSLLLAGVGLVASVRRWRGDPLSMLIVLNWATLIVVRATPWAPPHDGIRLFLPSFAFLAALAGVGAGRGLYRDTLFAPDEEKIVAQGWARVTIGIVLVMGTVDAISYFPHGLSFYNRLIGGLRGAVALGMEPTYYWDGLDRRALEWLADNTAGDEKVAFASAPPRNLELLKRWGLLERLPSDPGRFRWYVIQRRPSAWQPVDRWLIENAQPAYQRTFKGVPLLDVYDYGLVAKARAATESSSP